LIKATSFIRIFKENIYTAQIYFISQSKERAGCTKQRKLRNRTSSHETFYLSQLLLPFLN